MVEAGRVGELRARLASTPAVIQIDGADAPNPEYTAIEVAIDTGLTPEECQNLAQQGVQDIRFVVTIAGVEAARAMVRLDERLQKGEREFRGGDGDEQR